MQQAGIYMLSRSELFGYRASKGDRALRRVLNVHVGCQLGPGSIICSAHQMMPVKQKGVLVARTFAATSIFGSDWLN